MSATDYIFAGVGVVIQIVVANLLPLVIIVVIVGALTGGFGTDESGITWVHHHWLAIFLAWIFVTGPAIPTGMERRYYGSD